MFYPLTRPLSAPEVGYDTHLCSVLGGCCTVSTVPLLHLPVYPGKCSVDRSLKSPPRIPQCVTVNLILRFGSIWPNEPGESNPRYITPFSVLGCGHGAMSMASMCVYSKLTRLTSRSG